MFLDPKKRGRWLAEIFGGPTATCPRFVMDGKSGEKTQDPDTVKAIYLKEGASFLRAKVECPPFFGI